VHADEWAVLPDDDAEKALCSVIHYPNNEYEYCDIENVGLAACTGKKHNTYFFSDLGFFGQDCPSWKYLQDYMEGLLTLDMMDEICAKTAESANRRLRKGGDGYREPPPALTFDEAEVNHPRVNDWTDKDMT
jgi:hypothetical protein